MLVYIKREIVSDYVYWTVFADEYVEILDTADCVIEKYKLSEINDYTAKLHIKGFADSIGVARTACYYPIKEILGGRFTAKGSDCFYNKKNVLHFSEVRTEQMIRIRNKADGVIASIYLNYEVLFTDIGIQYAEKVGDYLLVAIRVRLYNRREDVEGCILMKFVFDDKKLLGILGYLMDGTSDVKDVSIESVGKLDKALYARFRLMGDL